MPRLIKRSLTFSGRRTSVALEAAFWTELERIAKSSGISLTKLIERVAEQTDDTGLASELRVYVLEAKLPRSGNGDGAS